MATDSNSKKALIFLIIGLIYPLLIVIFALLGTYLGHQSNCHNYEFIGCTGAFDGFLANIYNYLVFIVIFGAIIFFPATILLLYLAGVFWYKSKKEKQV